MLNVCVINASALLVAYAVVCGGMGAWLDSFIQGRDVVYRKVQNKVAVSVAPLVDLSGRRQIGINGSTTWR